MWRDAKRDLSDLQFVHLNHIYQLWAQCTAKREVTVIMSRAPETPCNNPIIKAPSWHPCNQRTLNACKNHCKDFYGHNTYIPVLILLNTIPFSRPNIVAPSWSLLNSPLLVIPYNNSKELLPKIFAFPKSKNRVKRFHRKSNLFQTSNPHHCHHLHYERELLQLMEWQGETLLSVEWWPASPFVVHCCDLPL